MLNDYRELPDDDDFDEGYETARDLARELEFEPAEEPSWLSGLLFLSIVVALNLLAWAGVILAIKAILS